MSCFCPDVISTASQQGLLYGLFMSSLQSWFCLRRRRNTAFRRIHWYKACNLSLTFDNTTDILLYIYTIHRILPSRPTIDTLGSISGKCLMFPRNNLVRYQAIRRRVHHSFVKRNPHLCTLIIGLINGTSVWLTKLSCNYKDIKGLCRNIVRSCQLFI